jgi:hypothetical protein
VLGLFGVSENRTNDEKEWALNAKIWQVLEI